MQRFFIYLCLFIGLNSASAQETINNLSPKHVTPGLNSRGFSAGGMNPVFKAIAEDPDGTSAQDDLNGTRLLVSDAGSTNVHVLNAADGKVIASFATAGQAGRVYPSPNGRFGFVVHRDENRVSLVHSGLSTVDHVNHVDLVQGAPYIVATMNVGREPTHFFAHGNDIAFFNDKDGTIALLDQRLLGLSLDYTEITVAQPDHGAPVIYGDYILNGYLNLNRVDVYTRSGEQVATFEDCPRLHGEATASNHIAFGCEDGVLLIQAVNGSFSSVKLANPPGTPEGVRVGTIAAHEDSAVMVGNFGTGVIVIDPTAKTLTPIDLDANPLRMVFADSETLVILTADGKLHLITPNNAQRINSIQVMDAPDLEADGAVWPTFALQGDVIFVTNPEAQQLHEVTLKDLKLRRSLTLDFTPFTLTSLSIPGAIIHD